MTEEYMEWTVLGRVVGQATGWDVIDQFAMVVYGLIPVKGFEVPEGDLNFDFENGRIEAYDEDGICTFSVDMIDAMKGLDS